MSNCIFLVDVEATGQSSYSGVMTEFGVVELESANWFRGQLWDATPDPKIPAIPVPQKENTLWTVGYSEHDLANGFTRKAKDLKELAEAHRDWLEAIAKGRRIVFMSDNPGYDFERMNVFFDQAGLANPYGFSSRRIGDYYAGLSHKFHNTSRWKGLRKTAHNHSSHYDAMGNREAVLKLIAASEKLHRDNSSHGGELKQHLK